jgi:4-hydroxybenzoate polyprenyltransferase
MRALPPKPDRIAKDDRYPRRYNLGPDGRCQLWRLRRAAEAARHVACRLYGAGGDAGCTRDPAPDRRLAAIIFIALGAGASGALNMWWDADIDRVMKRTAKRPIPAGKVTAEKR